MSTTRQHIIETTSNLLERQGFHATGLNQIVTESETPRGSLYYYFPEGKEELAAEAIQFKARQMSEGMRHMLAAYADPVEAIYQAILGMANHVEGGGCKGGAPIAAVALETAGCSERLRQASELAYQALTTPIQEKLIAGGYGAARAASLALMINATIEGAVILSRTQQSSTPLRIVAGEIRTLLLCAASAP
jgi:TetR/AcrR family transcriptional regulator, lmrAB and yxaGH operons repressor